MLNNKENGGKTYWQAFKGCSILLIAVQTYMPMTNHAPNWGTINNRTTFDMLVSQVKDEKETEASRIPIGVLPHRVGSFQRRAAV